MALYGHRHRVRFGMTTGMAGLAAWSFLMAMAHGAGLMLIPLLAPLGAMGGPHAHHGMASGPLGPAARRGGRAQPGHAGDHRGAWRCWSMSWIGVGILRRGWINLDLIWTAALVAVGVWLLL